MASLPWRERLIVYLRCAAMAVCLLSCGAIFVTKLLAQVPITQVITTEDARQDEKLDTLKEFRQNQENYNREQGKRLEDLEEQQSKIVGIGIGGFSVLTALEGLMGILFFNRKRG